jgi:hypothetical protein
MAQVTWATQFQKQDVMRTITVGFQPYMPFSQQYAMSLRPEAEPGYFELTPQPEGDEMLPTTGKGKEYSFETRMKTYMGKGEEGLAYMSRYHSPDRATQVANAPPQGAATATSTAAKQLANMFKSRMDVRATPKGMSRDVGELTLGKLTRMLDKELKMSRTQDQIDRGPKRGGKFWGNDFDIQLERTGGTFKEFLNTKIGKKEMEGVHSLEMTRAAGNSTTSKLLSMSQKEMNDRSEKGAEAKFKAHVKDKLTVMNETIKDVVLKMSKEERELYNKTEATMLGRGAGAAGSGMLAARALVKAGSDVLLNRTLRDFIGKVSRSTLINELNGLTGLAKHLYQVRLGKKMLGFAMISAKPITVGEVTYPRFEPEPHIIVMEVGAGANQLVNGFGEWVVENKGVDSKIMSGYIADAETYASSQAILTQDRVDHMYESSSVNAAQMVIDSTGIAVGETVLSNVRLMPMDIAENIRQQMILHFREGGASKRFAQWYQRLFDKSNLLTRSWYNSISMVGKRGGSFSEEWTYGDDKGNPNKRFLGVWSKASQDTWKNDVGRNVSISPFIISRRKGVAAFRTGGDYGKD